MVRLTQTKWNGTVSHLSRTRMMATFAAAKSPHASSGHRERIASPGRPRGESGRFEPISDIAHRLDEVAPHLRTQTAHVHVDHVRAGIERVAPHVGQDFLPGAHLVWAAHQ